MRRSPPTKAELQALGRAVFDERVACGACGVIGLPIEAAGVRYCADCHHGCEADDCRHPLRSAPPAEQRLWWLGKHAQREGGDALARFLRANAEYMRTEGP